MAVAERFEPLIAQTVLGGVMPRAKSPSRVYYSVVPTRSIYETTLQTNPCPYRNLFSDMMLIHTAIPVARNDEPSAFVRGMDRIIQSLGRLQDGWNGDESRAPNEATVSQVQALLGVIPPKASLPDVEVEEDTGSVTLRWANPTSETVFSFVIAPDGSALAVKTTVGPETRVSSTRFGHGETGAVARYLEDDSAVGAAIAIA